MAKSPIAVEACYKFGPGLLCTCTLPGQFKGENRKSALLSDSEAPDEIAGNRKTGPPMSEIGKVSKSRKTCCRKSDNFQTDDGSRVKASK